MSNPSHVRPYPTRADVRKLFEPAFPDTDPQGLVSRYVQFEFHRFRLDQSFVIDGDLTERCRILHWYLCGYGPHRRLQLPLSAAQLRFLNAPAPLLGGARPELSVAAHSFITFELPGQRDMNDPEMLREVLYWWCVERSLAIAPLGELITPPQVRALIGQDPEASFPLNYFVRRSHALNPSLQSLRLDSATDRAALLIVMILRCARAPVLAQFLPRYAIAKFLKPAGGGRASIVERLLASLGEEGGGDLVSALQAALAAHKDEMAEEPGSKRGIGIGMCFTPDEAFESGLERGVAVIGPVNKASGLGQATRLSMDVLREAGFKPEVVDFDLDNPAPVGFSSKTDFKKLRVPKQINLLHLNAESIPLGFAYKDVALYDRSYNIGYFFWELDRLPKCQLLALDMLDEIWVSSEYNREIYEAFASVPVRNVGMAVEPLAVKVAGNRAAFGIEADEFVFLTTFDSFSFVERKNPLAVLRAFGRAFPVSRAERVKLVIKTQNRERVSDPHQVRIWQAIDQIIRTDDRIQIIDETLIYKELLELKKSCDCYVSLHRSEGWGFGIIEAMQLDLPVIATGYSGNMDFCSAQNCYLVDYELVTPMPAEYIFVERGSRWAEPSVEHAAAHMRSAFEDPGEARRRADLAARTIAEKFSLGAIARRYKARLDEIEALVSPPGA